MLKLSQIKKHVYTHAEIIGNGYPEQWSKAQAIATHLAALQEKVLPTLPCLHRSLPADYIQLQEFDAVVRYKQMEMERANEGGGQQVATTPEDFMVDACLIQPHQAIC